MNPKVIGSYTFNCSCLSFITEDEIDMFECGRCQQKFTELPDFMEHKKSRVCRKRKDPSSAPDAVTTAGSGEAVAKEAPEDGGESKGTCCL